MTSPPLFDTSVPLAERVRPESLADILGQSQALGEHTPFGRGLKQGHLSSMILWGPPGSGKTTLAQVIGKRNQAHWLSLSAVLGGVREIRAAVEKAERYKQEGPQPTLLFVDEIHRFNRAQQDLLLPHVEKGTLTLIGATTENPAFSINTALLSRCHLVRLEPLTEATVITLLERALERDPALNQAGVGVDAEALQAIARYCEGDARRALMLLEQCVQAFDGHAPKAAASVSIADVKTALQHAAMIYDKQGEAHYTVISALIKSMRGNDPDAAIYWMMRALEGGEEPQFILRRLIIFASEDVGNADPQALQIALSADQAFARLGMPEGIFALSQCCTYLASTVKSNAAYLAWTQAQQDVREHGSLPVPMHLRNAENARLKAWGYGRGYRYPHDEGGHASGQVYLPEALQEKRYYKPLNVGFEAKLKARLERLRGDR